MKDYKFEFEVDEQKYTLVFNLNVMETIQAKYGSVQKWGRLTDSKKGEPNAKALIFTKTSIKTSCFKYSSNYFYNLLYCNILHLEFITALLQERALFWGSAVKNLPAVQDTWV